MESNTKNIKIKNPLICIVGSTASGKTKLSLELAKKYPGLIEIVNADAMQLYKGADIMTAKATAEEQQIVKHHLLDILPLEQLDYSRREYCDVAIKTISELHAAGKIPLIVGGTNYYIESILFNDYDISEQINLEEAEKLHQEIMKNLEDNNEDEEKKTEEISREDPIFRDWLHLNPSDKYNLLKRIDPLIAEKLHPNDVKRVENYIKLYLEENIIPSKKLMAINSMRKLRYESPIVFWIKDKYKKNLMKRIEKRINEMIDINGIKEIVQIYEYLESKGELNFTKGALQSIGYKEFHDFYKKCKEFASEKGLSKATELIELYHSKDDLENPLKDCLEECAKLLNVATQQYSKRQIRWIKNRLFDNELLKGHVFELEFSDASKFMEEAVDKGAAILDSYFDGKIEFKHDSQKQEGTDKERYMAWKKVYCDVCQIYLNGEKEFEAHSNSKRHKKCKEKKAKLEKNMEMKMKYELLKQEKEKQEKNEDSG
jgi:tRNA delta(2)-isopentenylpyrophosphate transferase